MLIHYVFSSLLIHLYMKGVDLNPNPLTEFKLRTSRRQAEEGCQRCSSSGAFQMFCKGCELILLKSETIFPDTKQPQCQQDTFVYQAWEHTDTHTETYADKKYFLGGMQ